MPFVVFHHFTKSALSDSPGESSYWHFKVIFSPTSTACGTENSDMDIWWPPERNISYDDQLLRNFNSIETGLIMLMYEKYDSKSISLYRVESVCILSNYISEK